MNTRQIKVIVNGTPYEVEMGDLSGSPTIVSVNGRQYEVVIEDGESQAGYLPKLERKEEVHYEKPAAIIPKARQEKQALSASSSEVKAPMPGTILDVVVKVGDKVSRGTQLCALEAMKMKSAIRAPQDGVVASVEVSEGQKVVFGDVLIRFA